MVHSLALVNPGRVNFDFTWDLGNQPRLAVKPLAGSVPKGERQLIELSYGPTTAEQLAGHVLRCKASGGLGAVRTAMLARAYVRLPCDRRR